MVKKAKIKGEENKQTLLVQIHKNQQVRIKIFKTSSLFRMRIKKWLQLEKKLVKK